jgi:hypothetical protein
LSALNTLHPVAKASTDTSEKRVNPEGLLGEDRTHLDSELPKTDGDACGKDRVSSHDLHFQSSGIGITMNALKKYWKS